MLTLPQIGVAPNVCLTMLQICGQCHAPNAKHSCSACSCRAYCSRECQKSDWKQHKRFCKALCALQIKTWVQAVDGSVEMLEHELIESAATEEGIDNDLVEPTTLTNDEIQNMFEEAIDLQAGQVGFIKARNRLVAAAGKLDHLDIFPNLEKGPQDAGRAKQLLLQAATAGHKGAMYNLAILNHGRDKDEMLKWCLRAAVNGHAEAQMTMGSHYWYRGNDGHAVNHTKALLWKRLALAHGAVAFPDPCGDYLSAKSFASGLHDIEVEGRKLYLAKCPLLLNKEQEYEGQHEEIDLEIKLAASCGCNGAIISCRIIE